MNKMRLRISESGAFAGNVRVGPGSVGIIARAHGVATATASYTIATDAPTPIPGLGNTAGGTIAPFAVDMIPGNAYELETHFGIEGEGNTNTVAVQSYYRLHYRDSNTWSAWVSTSPAGTLLVGSPLTTDANPYVEATDLKFGIQVTAVVDEIQVGAVATGPATMYSERAWARVSEYVLG